MESNMAGRRATAGSGRVRSEVKYDCDLSPTQVRVFASLPDSHLSAGISLDRQHHSVKVLQPPNPGAGAEGQSRTFRLDGVFCSQDSQSAVCDSVKSALNGNDVCLISVNPVNTDTLSIALHTLFSALNSEASGSGRRLPYVAAACVTGATCHDLLRQHASGESRLMCSGSQDVMSTLTALSVSSAEDAIMLYRTGMDRLETERESETEAGTGLGRGHSVVVVELRQMGTAESSGMENIIRSRVCLFQLGCKGNLASTGEVLDTVSDAIESVFTGHRHTGFGRSRKLQLILQSSLRSLLCHCAVLLHLTADDAPKEVVTRVLHQAESLRNITRRRPKKWGAMAPSRLAEAAARRAIGKWADGAKDTQSDIDLSSSEFSADTVIYRGPKVKQVMTSNAAENATSHHLCTPKKVKPGNNAAKTRHVLSRHSATDSTSPRRQHSLLETLSANRPSSAPLTCFISRSLGHKNTNHSHSANSHQETWIDGPNLVIEKTESTKPRVRDNSSRRVEEKLDMVSRWIQDHCTKNDSGIKSDRCRRELGYNDDNQSQYTESTSSLIMLTKFKTVESDSEEDDKEGENAITSIQKHMRIPSGLVAPRTKLKPDSTLNHSENPIDPKNEQFLTAIVNNSHGGCDSVSGSDVSRLEVIEVEERDQTVPMVDICLQVDEHDILASMNEMIPSPAQTINPHYFIPSLANRTTNSSGTNYWIKSTSSLNSKYKYDEIEYHLSQQQQQLYDMDLDLMERLHMGSAQEENKLCLSHNLSLTNLNLDNIGRLQQFYHQLAQGRVEEVALDLCPDLLHDNNHLPTSDLRSAVYQHGSVDRTVKTHFTGNLHVNDHHYSNLKY